MLRISKRKTALCLTLLELIKRPRLSIDLSGVIVLNNQLLKTITLSNTLLSMAPLNRETHHRLPFYYEEWVKKYIESDFFAHFRMCRKTFYLLLSEINRLERFKLGVIPDASASRGKLPVSGTAVVPLEKGLLMTIWYLAKGDTYISTADRFGVSLSTAHFHTSKTIKMLSELSQKFIKWPTKHESEYIAQEFFEHSGYRDVIGAIDGCHINCKVPEEQQDSYTNRKMSHSVVLQGVCTYSKLLTNVCIGFPGSIHDARVLKESELYKKIMNGMQLFYGKYHLIGDSAYPCLEWLMIPSRDTSHLSAQQKKHNTTLSKGRVSIEHVYALLKGRWRILKYVDVYSIRKVVLIISACCVLHNFCLLHDDFIEIQSDIVEFDDLVIMDHKEILNDSKLGTLKRKNITNNL